MSDRPKLIVHNATNSARTDSILENQDYIESLPIDGMIVNIPHSYYTMTAEEDVPDGVELNQDNLERWLTPLTDFNDGMHNYLLVNIDDPGDLFDDAAWQTVIDNFVAMAEGARDAGFKGLIYDNEEYAGQWDNFPEDYPGATADQLEEYQAQSSLRGQQIMEAVAEVWPDSEVGVMHGPYTSVDGGEETPDAVTDQVGGPERQELRGPFFTGMLEGKGEDQTLIDMGELYGARTEEELAETQEYRSERVPELIDWDVDAEKLENWDDEVVISHMVYTDNYPRDGVTADSVEATLEAAYGNSEEVVFLYSDAGETADNQLDWFTPGGVGDEWIAALENAAADYDAAQQDGDADPDPDPYPGEGDEDGDGQETQDLVGTEGADTIAGSNQNDSLSGLGGDDILVGGAGADALDGGAGTDWASYDGSASGVTVNLIDGEGYGGEAEGDTLTGIENVYATTSADLLVGDGAANTLIGLDGDDDLYGNGGTDWLRGGAGADIVAGGEGRDTASYAGSDGAVQVDLSTGTAAGGHATGDTLLGIENLAGSDGGDTLTGADDDSVLRGRDGNDTLDGRWGSDWLEGGAGDDTLTGGGNGDSFVFRIEDGAGRDRVTDFSVDEGDVLNLDGIAGDDDAAGFANLELTQVGADTEIAHGDGTIVLLGVDADTLTAGQFDFA